MFYLISIVFLAELIILFWLVGLILEFDKKVCAANEYVNKRRTLLKWRLETLKEITEGIRDIIPGIIEKSKKKKKMVILQQAKNVAEFVILLFFKPKYKKMLLGAKTGVRVAKKLLRV